MIRDYELIAPLVLDIDPLPAILPFDPALIRLHCHLSEEQVGGPYDAMLLDTYLRSAILWAEGEMHRTIVSRAHRWTLEQFPCNYEDWYKIHLPRGKTQSISSVVYSLNHSPVTLLGPSASPPGADFQQNLTSDDGGYIMPPIASIWPVADLDVTAPVVINFTAGYSTYATVPADIALALFFYVSDAVELRGTADINRGSFQDIRTNKISSYVLNRWY